MYEQTDWPWGRWLPILVLLWTAVAVRSVAAQQANGIVRPGPGESISGIVVIEGTAVDDSFMRYELAFFQEFNAANGWIVFAEGDQPVVNGTLALWDTTVGRGGNTPIFPDGRYQLRLRVVRTDFNYDEYFVTNLTIANDAPTPTVVTTPTITPTIPLAPTRTPAAAATAPAVRPDVLPTLTPFPTPTPPPTPFGAQPPGPVVADERGEAGLLSRLLAIDTGRFGDAFWLGVRMTGALFAALAAYVLLRNSVRWLWRRVWGRRLQRPDRQ